MTLANIGLHDVALKYYGLLPDRIRRYLNGRGIPDELIRRHLLGWNGRRITIPIPDREGRIVFFKLARDPEERRPSPKMFTYPGSSPELYGWETVLSHPEQITICEGEFDRLVLESKGFPAVTSTGGASYFSPAWAEVFFPIPRVYVCFDGDEAGRRGADRVARLIPHARIASFPQEVGEGGDITDFFVRLGRNREDFCSVLDTAQAPSSPPAPEKARRAPLLASGDRERVDRLKRHIRIEDVIGRYLALRRSGKNLKGLCPFHEDHEPSLAVFPATGTFHCFGCAKGGDAIAFLRAKEHLSFNRAVEALEQFTTHGEP